MKASDGGNVAIDDIKSGLTIPVSNTQLGTSAALADGTATPTVGGTAAYNFGFNGATWDRLRSYAGNASGVTAPTLGLLGVANFGRLFNGTTWDLQKGDSGAVRNNPAHYTYTRLTADGQVKSVAGFLHTVNLAATGVVTGGVLTLYDNPAETGTPLFSVLVPTSLSALTLTFDCQLVNGLYVGYDATLANVQVTTSTL